MYSLHELTPFRVLLLLWLMNGTTWLLLLMACRRAGLVTVRPDRALLRRSVVFGMKAYGAQASSTWCFGWIRYWCAGTRGIASSACTRSPLPSPRCCGCLPTRLPPR